MCVGEIFYVEPPFGCRVMALGAFSSPLAYDCMIVHTCLGLQTLSIDLNVQEISKTCDTWPPPARLQSGWGDGPAAGWKWKEVGGILCPVPTDGPDSTFSGLQRRGTWPGSWACWGLEVTHLQRACGLLLLLDWQGEVCATETYCVPYMAATPFLLPRARTWIRTWSPFWFCSLLVTW